MTPVIVKYKATWKKEPRYKLTILVITNIFCHSLVPSLYRGSTVLNFIYLFFKNWGGGGLPPPFPSPSFFTGPDKPKEMIATHYIYGLLRTNPIVFFCLPLANLHSFVSICLTVQVKSLYTTQFALNNVGANLSHVKVLK